MCFHGEYVVNALLKTSNSIDVAEIAFNKCIQTNDLHCTKSQMIDPNSETFFVHFQYLSIDDFVIRNK